MKRIVALFVVLIVFSTGTVFAMSTQGPTGLITIPIADVLSERTVEVGYHTTGNYGTLGLIAGLVPNLELGVATISSGKDSRFVGHAKYRFLKETYSTPAVAVGLRDTEFYMVAARALSSFGARGHFGIGSEQGLFAGVSKVLNPVTVSSSNTRIAIPTVSVAAEYDTSGFNVGMTAVFDPDIRLRVNLYDLRTVGFGLDFRFGF